MPQQPELRLFVGADLVGSTKLKNDLNQPLLWEKYEMRWRLVEGLRRQQPGLQLDEEKAKFAILQSLGIGAEDFDWVTVVEAFYQDLHNHFAAELKKTSLPGIKLADPRPWKAIGDELLYQFQIENRTQLYWTLVGFVKALRQTDAKLSKPSKGMPVLRVKGTAWVAGFPIRNRVIKLPAVEAEDFLGPDIDTGFRLGKYTQPGMLTVSVELAELLAETPDLDQFLGKVVGWEKLKGVWNDFPYPIVWVDLPTGQLTDELKASPFNDWQQQENTFCKEWEKPSANQQLRELAGKLRELRQLLPPTLGLVDPYIITDGDEMPLAHQKIRELLEKIQSFTVTAGMQGDENQSEAPPISEEQVKELVAGALESPTKMMPEEN